MNPIPHLFDTIGKPWNLNNKPWLVVGKGPTFSHIYQLFLEEFLVFCLNHTCEIIPCTIGACIDIEVLSDKFVANSEHVLLPWHVHSKYKSTNHPLDYQLHHNPILKLIEGIDTKLYYVSLSTWKGQHTSEPVLTVRYNIGELPFQILGRLGVKKIYSVGIDGGTKYNEQFKNLTPMGNGRSFDKSIGMIGKTCKEYNIEWVRL